MASVNKEPGGRKVIQFVGPDKRRHSIRLGKASPRAAEEVRVRVEYLLAAKRLNAPLDAATAAWLAGVDDQTHERIARAGLCGPRGGALLGNFLEAFRAARAGQSPSSVASMKSAAGRFLQFFDVGCDLRTITEGDAARWLLWARQHYSDATVGRDVLHARSWWHAARRDKLVTDNPFSGLRAPSQINPARACHVDAATARRVYDACPGGQIRLVFALARWGGFRTPSEARALTWGDVFRDHPARLRVTGKTGVRWCPLFPELVEAIDAAWDRATEGEPRVLPALPAAQVLRRQLERVLHVAGVDLWPRLWHNLRASRQTELVDQGYPEHVVARWLGNSSVIARKHYLQLTDEHFVRAAGGFAAGAESGADRAGLVRNAVHLSTPLDASPTLGAASGADQGEAP